jgi:hypothetical protein
LFALADKDLCKDSQHALYDDDDDDNARVQSRFSYIQRMKHAIKKRDERESKKQGQTFSS